MGITAPIFTYNKKPVVLAELISGWAKIEY